MASVVVFSSQPGRVVALTVPGVAAQAATGPFSMDGWQGFVGFNSIITRCMLSTQCNAQFLHTLGGDIYVYTFGDRIGQIGVSGLAFSGSCRTGTKTGIEQVLSYYNANRVSKRETPLTISFSGLSLKALLIAAVADVADAETQVFQFDFQMALIPDNGRDALADAKNKAAGANEEPGADASGDFSIGNNGDNGISGPDGRPSSQLPFLTDSSLQLPLQGG